MPQSLSKVYIHIVFSTKHRKNLIDKEIEGELFNYLGGICKACNCNPVQVGGYRNHVHILCTLARDITQSYLVRQLKQDSSRWIKTKGRRYSSFCWQNGYGIFSVNRTRVEAVSRYIQNQEHHHQRKNFKEEFMLFLQKNEVEYDDRYIWG